MAILTTVRRWQGTADVPGGPAAATGTGSPAVKIASKKRKSDHNQSFARKSGVIRYSFYPYSFNIPSNFWVIECCQHSIIYFNF